MNTCSVDGCKKSSHCRSFCVKHYMRFKRHGDPLVSQKKSYTGILCARDGCGVQATWAGWCGKHAMRVKRYGNPDRITTEDERRIRSREAQPTLGKLKPTTYKKYLGRHLHRRVAEEKIGRPLLRGEIVHHIDEDKHNNHPDNLEILFDQSCHIRAHHKNGTFRRAKC